MRSWKVGKKALKVFQAQVCSMACTEGVRWTINNDINVWQIKWLVNNLLTALTSEPLSGIDQPAVPGFVWQGGSLWFLLGWMERAAKKTLFCFSSCACREQKSKQVTVHYIPYRSTFIHLWHSHKIKSENEPVRLFRLFESFILKLLIICNNPGTGFFVHSCHVVGLHGNRVNGNLDGHNLSPYIKIIVC